MTKYIQIILAIFALILFIGFVATNEKLDQVLQPNNNYDLPIVDKI